MRSHRAVAKKPSRKDMPFVENDAIGSNGIAVTPPNYGIDALDSNLLSGSIHPPPKLTINQPNDSYEQEANAIAEQVMKQPTTKHPLALMAHQSSLQRQADVSTALNAPPSVYKTLRSLGQPLDSDTRSLMETRLGEDFRDVCVHTNPQAAQSAEEVKSRAYTVGKDVVFGKGQYAPRTNKGQRLLAHELAHVRQQSNSQPRLQRQVDVDIEVATPETQATLRQQGVQLPRVSAAASDPRKHSEYIDGKVTAVGFSIMLGGYAVYIEGLDMPLYVPDSYVSLGLQDVYNVDNAIYPDRDSAEHHIPIGPPAPGQGQPITYYRGGYTSAPQLVIPTIFSPATTPRIIQTMKNARTELAEYVQHEMMILLISLLGGFVFRAAVNRVARIGSGSPKSLGASGRQATSNPAKAPAPKASPTATPKEPLFAKPTVKGDPKLPAGEGSTDPLGNITYSTKGTPKDQALVLNHERVHSFLSPKFKLLRNLRAGIGMKAYSKSQFMRYLEEALAETYAQMRVNGINFKSAIEGIKFPVANGYVSVSGVVTEAAIGTVVIGGVSYGVYAITTPEAESTTTPPKK